MSRPLPTPTKISAPFWESCRREAMQLQRCGQCETWAYYPTYACPECGADRLEWRAVGGRGTVYSLTVPTRSTFELQGALIVALIELEEGAVMMSNIVDAAPEAVAIGAPVTLCYARQTEEITLPMFRLAES